MLFDAPDLDKTTIRRGYIAPIPETGWRPPAQYPEYFAQAVRLAYDIEARETDLEHGAGWGRKTGYPVGISIAAQFANGDIKSVYMPFDHDMQREYNMPKADVVAFTKWLLESTPHIPKFGANLIYDYGWMLEMGIKPRGAHYDVQFAEALLYPRARVALETLGQKYLGLGKETDALYAWTRATFPKTAESKLRKHIWQSPTTLVGYYAEQDAVLPLQIIEKQWPLLAANGLVETFELECALIPLLTEMRMDGVSIDMDATVQLRDQLVGEVSTESQDLYRQFGREFNIQSNQEIGSLCDHLGLKYRRTAAGAPSFQKEWMQAQAHPLFKEINKLREKEKIISTFLEGYFINGSSNGKIHCSFHPLRGDDGGTVTGRFSSSNPNLQNIPSRSKLGKQLRQLIVPDKHHETMYCGDYSQIEYRVLAHFACGAGSDALRERYNRDPQTDYHDLTIALVHDVVGLLIERKYIKNINFGLLYGMSQKKLAAQLGIAAGESDTLFTAYHAGAPYVKPTMAAAAREADEFGYVRTLLGRKGYFDMYVPSGQRGVEALPYEQALNMWGYMIEKDALYKAINYKIQGSAADVMKKAMVDGYRAGIFDVTGVPRLTVHDELVFSLKEKTPLVQEALREFCHIAETGFPFKVPVSFEADYGNTWGNAKPD